MSKDHHVFYNDDWADNGGVGFASFGTQADALQFIAERMKRLPVPDLARYTYIIGEILPLEAAQRVTEIRVASLLPPARLT